MVEDYLYYDSLIENLRLRIKESDQANQRLGGVPAGLASSDRIQPQSNKSEVQASDIRTNDKDILAIVDNFCNIITDRTKTLHPFPSDLEPELFKTATGQRQDTQGKYDEIDSLRQKVDILHKEKEQLLSTLESERAKSAQLRAGRREWQNSHSILYQKEVRDAINKARTDYVQEIGALKSKLQLLTEETQRLQLVRKSLRRERENTLNRVPSKQPTFFNYIHNAQKKSFSCNFW